MRFCRRAMTLGLCQISPESVTVYLRKVAPDVDAVRLILPTADDAKFAYAKNLDLTGRFCISFKGGDTAAFMALANSAFALTVPKPVLGTHAEARRGGERRAMAENKRKG